MINQIKSDSWVLNPLPIADLNESNIRIMALFKEKITPIVTDSDKNDPAY
jgi:hypothetical protein